ncbi:MAG: hypothetical protein HY653_08850 [Acidobacteria bacterium]|nr:hypothetical protein [Acidobacteriota bacterium]
MITQAWAVASAIVATLLAAMAALLLKRGATETRFALRGLRVSRQVLGAVVLYLLATFLGALALLGMQLSVLVPLTSLEYVWIALLARRYLGEHIGLGKAAGITCIVLGVVLVGLGS